MSSSLSATAVASRKQRLASVRNRMSDAGVDVLLLSLGADLPWLTGYDAMPLERLTVLVVCQGADPVLVVPELEAPRVPDAGDLFELRPWSELEDPVAIVDGIVAKFVGSNAGKSTSAGSALNAAISDRAWATTVLSFQERFPNASWSRSSRVTSDVRALKDEAEVACLRAASAAADRVAVQLQSGELEVRGRTEAEVSEDISARLVAEGHDHVNFAIVGSGPNGASPHHHASDRIIERGDVVVCDFGGALALDGDVGYCSDITRTVTVGEPSDPEVLHCYEVLFEAQAAGVAAVKPGVTAQSVDDVTRAVIEDAGLGKRFIHRTGHGIGIEEHEDPYIVKGNDTVLKAGHCFSVEPGIYLPGRFGMRLEDIVVVTETGVESLNLADHSMAVVGA